MVKNKKQMIIILILIFIVCIFGFRKSILKIIYPKTYSQEVLTYANKYKIEENFIFAVIKAESNFNKEAVSNRNATGLMQLMEETAKDVAKKNSIDINIYNIKVELLDTSKNIEIGTCYLKTLMDRYKNKEVALAAYNAGIGTVDIWIDKGVIKKDGTDIENIPYKETNNYVRKILRDYRIYEKLYN